MTDHSEFDIDISSSDDGAEAIVCVRGEIDLDNAHEIRSIVSVLAGWNETQRVVVDLTGVTFMDSSGISALILCLRDLQKAERHFEVVGASGAALRVLEMTGVLAFLSPPTKSTGESNTIEPAVATESAAANIAEVRAIMRLNPPIAESGTLAAS